MINGNNDDNKPKRFYQQKTIISHNFFDQFLQHKQKLECSEKPDPLTRKAKKHYELQAELYEEWVKQHKFDGFSRRILFYALIGGSGCYSLFLMAIILLVGFVNSKFNLSDKIIIAFIGGTAVHIASVFIVIAKYLFSKDAGHLKSESLNGLCDKEARQDINTP